MGMRRRRRAFRLVSAALFLAALTLRAVLLPESQSSSVHTWTTSVDELAALPVTKHGNPKLPIKPLESHGNETTRPKFIIHIGPHKTATTTMQVELASFQDELRRDNYIYLGKKTNETTVIQDRLLSRPCLGALNRAFNKTGSYSRVPCFKEVVAEIESLYEGRRNVILSSENLQDGRMLEQYEQHPEYWTSLLTALKDWDVQIVATYRRHVELALSALNYKNRRCFWSDGHKAGKWPHQGGDKCAEPFSTIRAWMNGSEDMHLTHTLDKILPVWSEYGVNVTVMNFHSGLHITSEFGCNILTDAQHTCQRSLKEKPTTWNMDHSIPMKCRYDSIVMAAAEAGLVDFNSTRYEVHSHFMHYHRRADDFPLLCPSNEELEELLNMSLALEKQLLPEFYAAHAEVHRSSFWKKVEAKEFCHVDVDRVLDGKTSWQEVLESLKSIKRS